jgi:hypothetical protein
MATLQTTGWVLMPFFIGAAITGYLGAKPPKRGHIALQVNRNEDEQPRRLAVAVHCLGSSGLAVVLMTFLFAEGFANKDLAHESLFVLFLNAPLCIFSLMASYFSLKLYLALGKLHKEELLREKQGAGGWADVSGSV